MIESLAAMPQITRKRVRACFTVSTESPAVKHTVPSALVPSKMDFTDKVPDEAFVDDVHRKLRLRRVMGHKNESNDTPSPGLKFTKDQVNYRYPATNDKQCQSCVFFREPGSCKIVDGLIRRVDMCDKYEAGEHPRASIVAATEANIVESVAVEVVKEGGPGSGRQPRSVVDPALVATIRKMFALKTAVTSEAIYQ